jgi:hypothetical protein
VVIVLSLKISSVLGGEGNTHGFSDSKKLTRTLVDATFLLTRAFPVALSRGRIDSCAPRDRTGSGVTDDGRRAHLGRSV